MQVIADTPNGIFLLIVESGCASWRDESTGKRVSPVWTDDQFDAIDWLFENYNTFPEFILDKQP